MKLKYFKIKTIVLVLCLLTSSIAMAQVGIGTENPDASSILDMQSTTAGLLIPRMTTTQRDDILVPAEGLQIYNTTNKSSDIYIDGIWKSFVFSGDPTVNSNIVNVYSIDDLPTPVSGSITLDATKMYIFSGMVDISSNYITINGAGLRGNDPQKDGVMSSVGGAVLRSADNSVFMQNFTVMPTSGKAYDFSDSTGTKFCNIFSGCSVIGGSVGQVSGFEAITFVKNYWAVSDGLKVTGDVGKFAANLCFITGITSGSGLEFLSGLTINDIDLANNYFIYTGQTGISVDAAATIDRGRMTTNMFRDVATPLTGIDSYSPGWSMSQNTNIPNSRAYGFIYFNNNTTSTAMTDPYGSFYKIAGVTTTIDAKRFTADDNKLTYNGVEPIVGKVSIVISAKAPSNNSDYSIGLGKNGTALIAPISSMAATSNNQSFQIVLNTEVDLVNGDFLEVYISRRSSGTSLTVEELQFRVTD